MMMKSSHRLRLSHSSMLTLTGEGLMLSIGTQVLCDRSLSMDEVLEGIDLSMWMGLSMPNGIAFTGI